MPPAHRPGMMPSRLFDSVALKRASVAVMTLAVCGFVAHASIALHQNQNTEDLVVAGLSLPLGSLGLEGALRQWRVVSGTSWCPFFLTLAIVRCGSRALLDLGAGEDG